MGEKTVDMTKGSILPKMIRFALPVLLGMLFQRIYNFVDVYIVGRYLGDEALAAVSIAGGAMYLLFSIMMGLTTGVSVVVSQYYGGGDEKKVTETFVSSIYVAVVSTLIITIAGLIGARPLLRILQTSNDLIDQATVYLMVVFAGAVGTMLYNWISAVLRSLGNSVVPLVFLIISSAINIALDLICIINLHMGVSGAAVATVASQLISGILCLIYMMKKFEILHITKDEWKLSMPHIGMLCAMGVPMGLQYSITAIGSVILQSSVNTLGATAVAAVTAGSKVSMFFCCAFDALGTTMATYGGQNVGAKKLDRLGKGLFACSIFGSVYSIVAFIIMYFAGGTLCGLFVTDASKELLDSSREFLLINAAFFIPLVFVNVIRYMIQGMGFSTFAILSGVFEMIARTLMGIFIVPVFGFTGACFASPLAWIMADIFLIPAYFYVKRKLERTLNGEKTAAA